MKQTKQCNTCHKRAGTVLSEQLAKAAKRTEAYAKQHVRVWNMDNPPLAASIEAWARIADRYYDDYEQPIGEDSYSSTRDAWVRMGTGLISFAENLPGELNDGITDATIRAIGASQGLQRYDL